MTVQSTESKSAQLRVQQKWRPSLAMIVCAVLTTVTALPLAGLFSFRLYENQLIRQTEAELTAQMGGTFATSPAADAPARGERPFARIEPSLDLAGSKILGPRPDGRPPASPPDAALLDIGRRLQPVLANAQKVTLAGFRLLASSSPAATRSGCRLRPSRRLRGRFAASTRACCGCASAACRRRRSIRSRAAPASASSRRCL